MTIINLFIIAIALSMDTFSLSLSLTMISNKLNKQTIFIFLVGFFHFLLPIIGHFVGQKVLNYITIDTNTLLGIIFLLLFFKLLYDVKHESLHSFNINTIYIILLSIIVSIDAFIVGIGLPNAICKSILPSLIFSLTSATFTFLGLYLGQKANNNLGKRANYLGLILLFVLGIVHLCKLN